MKITTADKLYGSEYRDVGTYIYFCNICGPINRGDR